MYATLLCRASSRALYHSYPSCQSSINPSLVTQLFLPDSMYHSSLLTYHIITSYFLILPFLPPPLSYHSFFLPTPTIPPYSLILSFLLLSLSFHFSLLLYPTISPSHSFVSIFQSPCYKCGKADKYFMSLLSPPTRT